MLLHNDSQLSPLTLILLHAARRGRELRQALAADPTPQPTPAGDQRPAADDPTKQDPHER